MRKPTVYLAGPMLGASDGEKSDWREEIIRRFGGEWTFRNPVDRTTSDRREIVVGERNDIFAADAVLAYVPRPTMGTAMGIMYGWLSHRTVVVLHPAGSGPLSNMIDFHADAIVQTAEEALAFILARLRRHSIRKISYTVEKQSEFHDETVQEEMQKALCDGVPSEVSAQLDKLATAVRMYLEDEVEAGRLDAEQLTIYELQDAIALILMDHEHRGGIASLAKSYLEYRTRSDTDQRLRQNEQYFQRFVLGTFHDLKAPFGNISRCIDRLGAEFVGNRSERATRLFQDIETNKNEILRQLHTSKVKLDHWSAKEEIVLRDELARKEKTCRSAGHELFIDCPSDLLATLQSQKLRGIIDNIIQNGIAHGFNGNERGRFVIEAGADVPNAQLTLNISNSGMPMTAVEGKLALSGAGDAGEAGDAAQANWGMGLPLVRTLAEAMGGSISIENSSAAGGPKFCIVFSNVKLRYAPSAPQKTVLVADDCEADRDSERMALTEGGFKVQEASTIDSAIACLRADLHGAVVNVDFTGESHDGIWLLKRIRADYPSTIVVVISGSSIPGWEDKAMAAGAHRCLRKAEWTDRDLVSVFE